MPAAEIPPASPSAPPAGTVPPEGIFRRVLRALTPGTRDHKGPPKQTLPEAVPPVLATPDLSAYRRRAAELLERLCRSRGADAGNRFAELGFLMVQLQALLEDLRSIGAPATEVEPLDKLLAELSLRSTRTPPSEETLDRLWRQAEQTLQSFSQGVGEQPTSASPRREQFWK